MPGPNDADRSAALAAAATDPRPAVSRRNVLWGAAGAGAAGLVAATGAAAAPAAPAVAATARPASVAAGREVPAGVADARSEPVVVHLRDARSGEMDVFAGTRHTRLRDPDLAARLARAAR
jgi:hypothetical protein